MRIFISCYNYTKHGNTCICVDLERLGHALHISWSQYRSGCHLFASWSSTTLNEQMENWFHLQVHPCSLHVLFCNQVGCECAVSRAGKLWRLLSACWLASTHFADSDLYSGQDQMAHSLFLCLGDARGPHQSGKWVLSRISEAKEDSE